MYFFFAIPGENGDKNVNPQLCCLLEKKIHFLSFQQGLGQNKRCCDLWGRGPGENLYGSFLGRNVNDLPRNDFSATVIECESGLCRQAENGCNMVGLLAGNLECRAGDSGRIIKKATHTL